MKIIRTKKKFLYKGIELKIVVREEPYMNAKDPVEVTRVVAPNGGVIPININKGQTLKAIQEEVIRTLENFEDLGVDIKKELTKKL